MHADCELEVLITENLDFRSQIEMSTVWGLVATFALPAPLALLLLLNLPVPKSVPDLIDSRFYFRDSSH